MLAHLLRRQGQADEGLAIINQSLEHPGTDAFTARLFEERGYLFADREQGAESLRDADQALALGAESVSARYLRGRALALLGRLPEAQVDLQRVLTLDPNHEGAKQALRQMEDAMGRSQNRLLRWLTGWWKRKQS
jgi:tetratricopeptide (TPR) repeat protein